MTINMEYSSTFITGAANTVSHGIVWIPATDLVTGHDNHGMNLMAYTLSNSIAIVDDVSTRVLCTLRSPLLTEDRLTSLLYCFDVKTSLLCLVAGSEKGVISVWTLPRCDADLSPFEISSCFSKWQLVQSVVHASCSIVTLTALSDEQFGLIIVSSDANGNCSIHKRHENIDSTTMSEWLQVHQNLHFPLHQLPNATHIFKLSTKCICLALGGVDAKIHLYISSKVDGFFKNVGVLSGHEEWITCIASLNLSEKITFIASASQDNKIRIWKFQQTNSSSFFPKNDTVIASVDATSEDDEDEGEDIVEEGEGNPTSDLVIIQDESANLSSEARLHFIGDDDQTILFLVFLDALLIGHEDWVTSVDWMYVPDLSPNGENAKLFSTSMDRNMVIWSPDSTAGGIWEPIVRVGDIGGALGGSIGGNLLGFVGGRASPKGDSLIGIGYGGSFHYWKKTLSPDDSNEQRWFPRPFLTGHFDVVTDVSWEQSQGLYVVSVSSDQTCRIFCPIKTKESATSSSCGPLWKEVSRPEIHGYNLNCLALSKTSYELLTAGEEKLIRGFDAPNLVLRGFQELCGINLPYPCSTKIEEAYIPELGLSNKGKEMMTNQEIKEQEARGVSVITWRSPPLESQLSDHTLWLETRKMFGHNNEVVCMAMSPNGKWLASSSKARYSHSCFILLWSLETHSLVAKLSGHESTASCLEFSPNGRFLASSGKDRSICIYSLLEDPNTGEWSYSPVLCYKNAHKRIIWDVSWSEDGNFLVTASRDGNCKIWKITSNADSSTVQLQTSHSFSPFGSVPVTAVELDKIHSFQNDSHWIMIVGSEQGSMQIWKLSKISGEPSLMFEVPSMYCHSKAVRRLKWRPTSTHDYCNEYEWVSGSEDSSIRVHKMTVTV